MRNLFIILPHFISVLLFSQDTTVTYDFIGALHTSNQEIISYKINFKETGNGKIEGESITDFYGENYTKSKITGSFNSKKNLLSFSEVGNITTKSSEDEELFCYVRIKDLKIRTVKKKRIVQGKFSGLFQNGDSCATGSIYLVSSDLLEDLSIDEDSLRKLDSLVKIATSAKDIKLLKNNDKHLVHWSSDFIVLDVWDGSMEDNDIINIYFNDQIVEENLIIKNRVKTIKIPFKEGKGIIKVVAQNEGDKGTNSVYFLLRDGNKLNPVRCSLLTGEEVLIEFTR